MNAQNLPKNLIIISETGASLIPVLAEKNIGAGHFTNGTYAPPAALIVPTILAGFQYAVDNEVNKDAPLIIAVNSDKSMLLIMDKKIAMGTASNADKEALEDQNARAQKAAVPLALQHPDRKVVAVFYDEETPNKLYDSLNESGFRMDTLFKWGYGTDSNAGVIEGAESFGLVNAHPLPNDIKPVCTELTRMTGQKGDLHIVDLRTEAGTHGKPYISSGNECLFPLDSELLGYGQRGDPTSSSRAAKPAQPPQP
jgi:hypothetical protein